MITKGSLVRLESGEYSDYFVLGFFVALEDFDPREYHKKDTGVDGLAATLIREGKLLEIKHTVIHYGWGEMEVLEC